MMESHQVSGLKSSPGFSLLKVYLFVCTIVWVCEHVCVSQRWVSSSVILQLLFLSFEIGSLPKRELRDFARLWPARPCLHSLVVCWDHRCMPLHPGLCVLVVQMRNLRHNVLS